MIRTLSETERLAWLRLIRADHVGPITFRQLLRRYGTAERALAALPELARGGGAAKAPKPPTLAEAKAELARLDALGARAVAMVEPGYPPLLAEIEDAPPLIFVQGHLALLARPAVALVGSRNASLNGQRLAETMARELAAAGWCVVSGLALGIDGAAHRGALQAPDGATAAVVAGGIDVVYPPAHAALQSEIAARGVVVAECRVGTEPTARHFPRRNRLISGLARGVVVIEAAQRSGSLITARMAGEQGREVMAVPGSPLDARARGGNQLIKEGAALVESAADVLAALGQAPAPLAEAQGELFGAEPPADPDAAEVAAARAALAQLLDPSPVPVDEILRRCQFSPPAVQTALLELELAGRLERHPGNRVSLIAAPG